MRRLPRQRNRLPRAEGMFYIEPDFRVLHTAQCKSGARHMPETNDTSTPDPAGQTAGDVPAHGSNGQVADAVRGNWVDRYAPAAARPYLRLSRADRPIGTWLLLLPCWWGLMLAMLHDGQARWEDAWIALGCALGAWLMRGAGCTWNDITDRNIDAKVERTRSRPIPSGQVSPKAAAAYMGAQALIALAILLTFNGAAIVLGILALVPVAIYPFAKRFTWWPQVFLGFAFNWGALLAWTAHSGSLQWPAVVLYFAGMAWTLFYDTIYAHQDTEDDALIGVKSTARLFGSTTPKWLARFLVATVGLMGLAILLSGLDNLSPLALILALGGPWAMGWHMVWQMRKFDAEDNATLLMLFRSNRDTGLIPLLFFAVALFV
ncbi:4-hydroxybenzoate octaprenyltransferase [Litorivita pollutaquae]|uniref:4-hydroxybenzoate octaprenyltransferase n=2 Tax=Litorivita pollutaquae TaxID=2200892 RepID=A0A2V4MMZ7_9RHOB|nr:4-hydroxybenzoate octaprenyltransferase [Litorivita pollutaquae]